MRHNIFAHTIVLSIMMLPLSSQAIVGEVLQGAGIVVGGVGEGVERLGEKLSISNRHHSSDSSNGQSSNGTAKKGNSETVDQSPPETDG